MATILALEAATKACSVALRREGDIDELYEVTPKSHTRRMLPMVDELLAKHQLALDQLDAIAFSRGPGSFTGLRIAAGITQGLAFGAGLPVIAVSTLEAMAQRALKLGQAGPGQRIVSCLDARMDEVYLACWRVTEQGLQRLGDELLTRPTEWQADAADYVLLGDGIPLLAAAGSLGQATVVYRDDEALPHAEQICELAESAWQRGDTVQAHEAEPAYLRGKTAWKTVDQQGATS